MGEDTDGDGLDVTASNLPDLDPDLDLDLEEELFGDLQTEESVAAFVHQAYSDAYPPSAPITAQKPSQDSNPSAKAHPSPLKPSTTEALKAKKSAKLEERLLAARRVNESRVASDAKAAYMSRVGAVNAFIAAKMFDAVVALQRAQESETLLGTFLDLPARYGTSLWAFVRSDAQESEEQRLRVQATFSGFERMSVSAEVEQRLQGLDKARLESALEAFLSKGKDPHFRCQTMDEEFRKALRGEGGKGEGLIKGYLKVVLGNEAVRKVDNEVVRFIPHISARRQVVCFALQRVGDVVGLLLGKLVQRDVQTKALTPKDVLDYAQRGLRVLLKAIVTVYPELLDAKLEQRDGLLHESCLYTVAAVLEETTMRTLYEDVIAPTHRSLFLEEDDELVKCCTVVLCSHEDMQLKGELQVDSRLLNVDLKPVVVEMQRVWTTYSPFVKMEQLHAANRQIPACIRDYLSKQGPHKAVSLGADEILPLFVYCVLQSVPTHLASDIAMMEGFADESIKSGQVGYLLTMRTCRIPHYLGVLPDFQMK